jgi:uncharacterized GH25 family protein
MRKTKLAALCFGLSTLVCSSAHAHYPWMNLSTYSANTGSNIQINIGWGHNYPLGSFMKHEDLEYAMLKNAEGEDVPLNPKNEIELETAEGLSSPGTYIATANRKPGFYTRTTDGAKRQSKEGLDNVLACWYSESNMKSILIVGDEPGKISTEAVGQSMEIIPQENPASLRAGDYLPVKVLLKGEPYSGKIYATYMGFSTESDVFAYTANTNQEGMGKIRILQPGIWMIKVEHQEPYPDQAVCDTATYRNIMTLEIK